MSIEITGKMIETFLFEARPSKLWSDGEPDWPAGLAAVLAMPEVRQAIHDDVRRENEQKLRDLGVNGYSLEWDR